MMPARTAQKVVRAEGRLPLGEGSAGAINCDLLDACHLRNDGEEAAHGAEAIVDVLEDRGRVVRVHTGPVDVAQGEGGGSFGLGYDIFEGKRCAVAVAKGTLEGVLWIVARGVAGWGVLLDSAAPDQDLGRGGPCTRSTGATQTSLKVAPHTPLMAVWSLGMVWVQLPVVKPGFGPGWLALGHLESGAPTS